MSGEGRVLEWGGEEQRGIMVGRCGEGRRAWEGEEEGGRQLALVTLCFASAPLEDVSVQGRENPTFAPLLVGGLVEAKVAASKSRTSEMLVAAFPIHKIAVKDGSLSCAPAARR